MTGGVGGCGGLMMICPEQPPVITQSIAWPAAVLVWVVVVLRTFAVFAASDGFDGFMVVLVLVWNWFATACCTLATTSPDMICDMPLWATVVSVGMTVAPPVPPLR